MAALDSATLISSSSSSSSVSAAAATTTAALTARLSTLRARSSQLSTELLAKLTATSSTSRTTSSDGHKDNAASSSSGSSSLLHMASTISSILRPQLSRLDQDLLRPLLLDMEELQQVEKKELERIQILQKELEDMVWKGQETQVCSNFYQDLNRVLNILQQDQSKTNKKKNSEYEEEEDCMYRMVSLERAAHLIHSLSLQVSVASDQVRQLTSSSSSSSSSPNHPTRKSEASHFILKLAPPIRQAKEQLTQTLLNHLEYFLSLHQDKSSSRTNNLLILGHVFRSLTLLNESSAAERIFVKTVTMPIIRSILLPHSSTTSSTFNTSHGTTLMVSRLDEGGPRGECTGLASLLAEIITTLKNQYRDVFVYMEDMFYSDGLLDVDSSTTSTTLDSGSGVKKGDTTTTMTPTNPTTTVVDLITMGIWVPLATVLTADPTIKMAIFSPGIAHALQANYVTLDTCISNLASSLLLSSTTPATHTPSLDTENVERLDLFYHRPTHLPPSSVLKAQYRIQSHGTTTEFYKKFNLPIYYQLRFAEMTTRVNTALDRVRLEGWKATVYPGATTHSTTTSLQLPIFLEIQDCLVWMWSSQVYLKPMTHRFLRGVVQILGRFIAFIMDGLDGKILFGQQKSHEAVNAVGSNLGAIVDSSSHDTQSHINSSEGLYSWVDRIDDVASVSSDAAVFHSWIVGDYLHVIQRALSTTHNQTKDDSLDTTLSEMMSLCQDLLVDASRDLETIVTRSWDNVITEALIKKCVGPIAAVKGIAATFRMTNRPAPTLASPFVATILRSMKEFDSANGSRVPPIIGNRWKERVLNSIADKYSNSVAELIETVQKTEEALKNRKGRKTAASGLSDGDKVKMQLYLDSQEFLRQVQQMSLDPTSSIEGLRVLLSLTEDGKVLFDKGPSA